MLSWVKPSVRCSKTLIKNDLTVRIINYKEANALNGIRTRGRQILRQVYDFFKLDPSSGVLHNIEDLQAVKLQGNRLDLFLRSWDAVLIGMTKPPDPDLKHALFQKQLKGVVS